MSVDSALQTTAAPLRQRMPNWYPTGRTAITVAVAVVVVALSIVPMLRLAVLALAPAGALDLSAFAERLSRATTARAAIHTLDTSFFGALLALAIGGPFAAATSLTDLPGRRAVAFLVVLPLMIAPQVTALAWTHLFGPSSTLLAMVGLAPPPGTPNPMLGRGGIILLFGVQHAPIVFLTLRAGLIGTPRDLVEAARASGAAPARAFVDVVLPLVRPHIVAAFLLAFVSGVGNFGIPALLGMPVDYLTLTTLIYQKISSFGPTALPDAAALSAAIAAAALIGTGVGALALPARSARVAGGQRVQFGLGRVRLPAGIVAWSVVVLMVVAPALALVVTALVPAFGVPLTVSTATLDNFAEVLFRQAATGRAFVNSFLLSAGTALVAAAIALPLGWVVERAPRRWAHVVRALVDLPYAVPGIVVSIACILLFLKPLPIVGSLYGTLGILAVAYLMRFLALAAKPVGTAIAAIPRDLEEAAAASGAGPIRRLVTIVAPMSAAAAAAGALLVFMSAFNELTVSALLWSSGRETIGVILLSLEEAGLGTQAAAVAVVSLGVVIALLAAVDRLGRRLPPGVLPWR
ncbi:MAG: iron ABC transporter permease [Ancalomicrobiaceae bacterium]|nr:iron ABC transporter permease [Ancalomicrobiaceae bacterium]